MRLMRTWRWTIVSFLIAATLLGGVLYLLVG
jgi:hypothetical protein